MTLSSWFALITRRIRCLPVVAAMTILLAVLTLATAPAAVWAAPLFGTKTDISTGNRPQCAAIGDLNHDRRPDLAVANHQSNTVSVLLGNGNGTFGVKTDIGVGMNPWPVAIGDLNGNGDPDLAVAAEGLDTVSVLLGNGDGTFGARTGFYAGGHSLAMAMGDLNGDGKPDLVTADGYLDKISVLLDNGDGTFGVATGFGAGSNPWSVAIGDLNGDGKPDLAVANSGIISEEPGHTVSVLLGDGDGAFAPKTDYEAGIAPCSVALADLNGDGALDLVATGCFSNTVSVLFGNGDGTFGAKTDHDTGLGPVSVAIADLDGDWKLDLAVANRNSNTVSVLLGNGDGTFGSKSDYGTGNTPVHVAVGDLNGDCRPDLVVVNLDSGGVSVLLNIGTGTAGVGPAPSGAPRAFQLLPSRPSPSRGACEIRFLLPTACAVDVTLFDLAGRKVRSLVADRLSAPGEHGVRWDGRDGWGAPVRDGIYLVRVRAGRDVGVTKLAILR